jgi:hypothetical protein
MNCTVCQHPTRRLWTYQVHPDFIHIQTGNWISLKECPECHQYWCEVPHEPYASFPFWTAWPYSKSEWVRLNTMDDALILHEWHTNIIREDFAGLPPIDQEAVEAWRNRTYRNFNAIDQTPEFRYCNSSSAIETYITTNSEQGGGGNSAALRASP